VDEVDDHRALVGRLFPGLPLDGFRPVGDGWTCFTYATGSTDDAWIVQLPRSAYAAERLRFQAALLPELARELSAPIPVPEHVSPEPAAIAYRALAGVAATDAPDGIWPERLGRFLYDLHLVPPELVGLRGAPATAVRAAEREDWSRLRTAVAGALDAEDLALLDRTVAALFDDDDLWTFAAGLTHGDLGPGHVLVDGVGDLAAVIDWEEAAIGDPAGDLAWWLHERPAEGERALAAYGGAPDRAFRARCRLRWALMPWHDVDHGVRTGGSRFVADGLAGAHARRP
jgi:aminoglycoside phosphotransferase (APT) family kinase protein